VCGLLVVHELVRRGRASPGLVVQGHIYTLEIWQLEVVLVLSNVRDHGRRCCIEPGFHRRHCGSDVLDSVHNY